MSRYMPGNIPAEPRAIPSALTEELAKVSQAMSSPNEFLSLSLIYALPNKYREGDTVLAAAGVCGVAKGAYIFYDGVWNRLG